VAPLCGPAELVARLSAASNMGRPHLLFARPAQCARVGRSEPASVFAVRLDLGAVRVNRIEWRARLGLTRRVGGGGRDRAALDGVGTSAPAPRPRCRARLAGAKVAGSNWPGEPPPQWTSALVPAAAPRADMGRCALSARANNALGGQDETTRYIEKEVKVAISVGQTHGPRRRVALSSRRGARGPQNGSFSARLARRRRRRRSASHTHTLARIGLNYMIARGARAAAP
jgi:hypothetical protein